MRTKLRSRDILSVGALANTLLSASIFSYLVHVNIIRKNLFDSEYDQLKKQWFATESKTAGQVDDWMPDDGVKVRSNIFS